jgi:hypothetical protein
MFGEAPTSTPVLLGDDMVYCALCVRLLICGLFAVSATGKIRNGASFTRV